MNRGAIPVERETAPENFEVNVLSNSKHMLRGTGVMFSGVALGALAGVFGVSAAMGQEVALASAPMLKTVIAPAVASSSSEDAGAVAGLPDAPGYVAAGADGRLGGRQTAPVVRHSNRLDKVVDPGYAAERLTIGDKILLGVRENATIGSVAGWVFSAGYEQAVNGSPNYGQTGKGFAQRLGAAAARNSSENIFSDSIIAPILHEDPRYYKMGKGHSFVKRLAYSGTRGLLTRTDGGRQTINFANIGGDLGGSAVTQLYYPPINRNFTQVMQTWGGSVGGDAIGYVADEFLTDALVTLHLKKSQ